MAIRNVKLKPLRMKPIFNGKDLTGWKKFDADPKRAKSQFTVTKEGWLSIKNGPGDLQTTGEWADFVLQLDCRTNGDNLNSGVFFRCIPGQYQNGYEAQIQNQKAKEPKTYTIEEYDPNTHKLKDKKKVENWSQDYGTGAPILSMSQALKRIKGATAAFVDAPLLQAPCRQLQLRGRHRLLSPHTSPTVPPPILVATPLSPHSASSPSFLLLLLLLRRAIARPCLLPTAPGRSLPLSPRRRLSSCPLHAISSSSFRSSFSLPLTPFLLAAFARAPAAWLRFPSPSRCCFLASPLLPPCRTLASLSCRLTSHRRAPVVCCRPCFLLLALFVALGRFQPLSCPSASYHLLLPRRLSCRRSSPRASVCPVAFAATLPRLSLVCTSAAFALSVTAST